MATIRGLIHIFKRPDCRLRADNLCINLAAKTVPTQKRGKTILKKIFAIFIAAVMLLTCGCSGRTKQEKSVSAANQNNSGTNDVSNANWPTKTWSISTPEKQGVSSAGLEEADKLIKENYPNVRSLLVVRHGFLIYEKYYNGADRDKANPVYSVTKSIMSALTGIAIEQKLIKNVDQPVGELLPEYFKKIDNPRKKEITLKNVLTMSGGLETVDNNYASFFTSDDWLAYTLKKPMTDKPGTKFVYNTGLTQFLSNIITKVSGMNTKEFAEKYLFSKIGINAEHWVTDPKGYYGGGYGLSITPRDMAKFGYLYLNNGKWDGEQVIPQEWVEESTKKHITANESNDYGYLFWLKTLHNSANNKDYFSYRADGAGGQLIVQIPELDMVVVVTADVQVSSKNGKDTLYIVENYVLPSVDPIQET